MIIVMVTFLKRLHRHRDRKYHCKQTIIRRFVSRNSLQAIGHDSLSALFLVRLQEKRQTKDSTLISLMYEPNFSATVIKLGISGEDSLDKRVVTSNFVSGKSSTAISSKDDGH